MEAQKTPWENTYEPTQQRYHQLDDFTYEFEEEREGKIVNEVISLKDYDKDFILEAMAKVGYTEANLREWWQDPESRYLIANCIFEREAPVIDINGND